MLLDATTSERTTKQPKLAHTTLASNGLRGLVSLFQQSYSVSLADRKRRTPQHTVPTDEASSAESGTRAQEAEVASLTVVQQKGTTKSLRRKCLFWGELIVDLLIAEKLVGTGGWLGEELFWSLSSPAHGSGVGCMYQYCEITINHEFNGDFDMGRAEIFVHCI